MKKHKIKSTHNDATLDDIITKTLARMTRKDMQLACVKKGLEFHLVVSYDNHMLSNWFYKNFENGEDETKISEYDAFMEAELEKRGYKKGDPAMSPCFRLGYNPNKEINLIIPPKKLEAANITITLLPNIKPKREKDESNIVKGTKKSLTYQLTREGKTKEEIIALVSKKFSNAQPKSISIWITRAKKEMA
jgi:hypothetical protein